MCTVSYVPTGAANFILTSNRDENPERITHLPGEETTIVESNTIVCPKDSKAGGTWIAMSGTGKVACLLNGAFVKHKHQPPYRRSRGLILLDYFNFPSAAQFADKIDLDQIENFTLVMVENGKLFELRWDGENKYFKELNASTHHLWSSCTLYDEETANIKFRKFDEWIKSVHHPDSDLLANFHGYKNPEGYILDRPMVKTVSITTIQKQDLQLSMCYHDLINLHDVQRQLGLN